MRGLYGVWVVDPQKSGKVLVGGDVVIATSKEEAMLKAGVAQAAEKAGLDLDQVDIHVDCIATFIRPRKETGRVKIVKEDED